DCLLSRSVLHHCKDVIEVAISEACEHADRLPPALVDQREALARIELDTDAQLVAVDIHRHVELGLAALRAAFVGAGQEAHHHPFVAISSTHAATCALCQYPRCACSGFVPRSM